MLNESNKPTNPELWSKAKALAKKKFDVYPSAYANGWAAKWYKKHGGGWKSKGETNESVIAERHMTASEKIKEKHLHKKMASAKGSFRKRYPDRGDDVFYATTKKMAMEEIFARAKNILKEEIVNKHHAGTMTDKEKRERDHVAKTVKGIRAIKGNDSEKEAKYRYATYLVLRKRGEGSESKEKKGKKSKKKTSKKGKKK